LPRLRAVGPNHHGPALPANLAYFPDLAQACASAL
jgi:hypothetical protein